MFIARERANVMGKVLERNCARMPRGMLVWSSHGMVVATALQLDLPSSSQYYGKKIQYNDIYITHDALHMVAV
jgi:hypothetical protein